MPHYTAFLRSREKTVAEKVLFAFGMERLRSRPRPQVLADDIRSLANGAAKAERPAQTWTGESACTTEPDARPIGMTTAPNSGVSLLG